MDDMCPTLCITHELKSLGWRALQKHAVVTTANVHQKICDGREAIRWKPYFQVLYSVDQCLPLTSKIPSGQPQKFYKILLRGERAEPGLSDKEYTVILNAILKKKGKPPVPADPPLPLPPPFALPLDDDENFIADGPDEPEPKAKAKAKAKAKGQGRGKGGKPDHDAWLAPPAIGPPPPPVRPPAPGSPLAITDGPVVVPGPAVDPPPSDTETGSGIDDDGMILDYDESTAVNAKRVYKAGVGDAMVFFDKDYLDKGVPAPNWILKCPCHQGCYKSRKVSAASTRKFGAAEVLAYLHAWVPMEPRSRGGRPPTHRCANPSQQMVKDYFESHRDELQAAIARWE